MRDGTGTIDRRAHQRLAASFRPVAISGLTMP
jgi:hypothetical protein